MGNQELQIFKTLGVQLSHWRSLAEQMNCHATQQVLSATLTDKLKWTREVEIYNRDLQHSGDEGAKVIKDVFENTKQGVCALPTKRHRTASTSDGDGDFICEKQKKQDSI